MCRNDGCKTLNSEMWELEDFEAKWRRVCNHFSKCPDFLFSQSWSRKWVFVVLDRQCTAFLSTHYATFSDICWNDSCDTLNPHVSELEHFLEKRSVTCDLFWKLPEFHFSQTWSRKWVFGVLDRQCTAFSSTHYATLSDISRNDSLETSDPYISELKHF